MSAGLPLVIPQAFTQDVALHPIMRSVLPQVSAASALMVVGIAMFAVSLLPCAATCFVILRLLCTEFMLVAPLAGVSCNAAVRLGSQVWLLRR